MKRIWEVRTWEGRVYAHISSHPGYDINREQEFLQQHGQHALTVLLIVKYGFIDGSLDVPSLETFKVLKTPGTALRHDLTKDNIRMLVDKAIAYIRGLPRVDETF